MSTSRPGDIFQPGDLLNNTYRIEAILGRGGTSEVYRARSEISGRVVALKALKAEFSRNEDYLALMTREEDIREIRHDVIVRYYDNQRTDDGHVYLVMDFVDGPGLEAKMKQGGMSAADLMIVAERVAEGLVAAHGKKIVHRDLSPDNIILRNGNPADAVIIDFGIAKDTNPGAATIVGNEFAGKYAYAAPEQLSGQTDERADIYALGALLLATFRGKAPESGRNPMEVVQKKALPLDTSGVPEPLKSLIDKMTVPDRAKRLQSAQAVLAEIRGGGHDANEPEEERTVIVPRTTVPPKPAPVRATATPAGSTSPAKAAPVKTRRSRGPLIAVLLVLLLAAAGAGGYFTGAFDSLLGPKYPVANPFTLVAEKKPDGTVQAVGYVPSPQALKALSDKIAAVGGVAQLTLASGAIEKNWGDGILQLVDAVSVLPEWKLLVSGNQVKITGMTADHALRDQLTASLSAGGMPTGLSGTVAIDLGPRLVTTAMLSPLLKKFADCGDLKLVNPPATGYPTGATITVNGKFADTGSRVKLTDAITAISGDRNVKVDGEVFNPALCTIDAALPEAPAGGFDITFGFGDRPDPNPSGRYYVGENPVIDVTIPADVTTGYLFVSALDVSGNVFHMLPNLNRPDNSVATLRNGATGPVKVRVAYSLADAKDGKKLAFTVDASTLGKTEIVVLRAGSQIFEGLRPMTESAGSYVEALKSRTGPVASLDSRILTTAKP